MGNARRDRDHWIPHLCFLVVFPVFCGVGGKVLGFNRFPTNGPRGHNLNDDRPCFNERNHCFDVVVFNPRARDSLSLSVSYISDLILGFWTFFELQSKCLGLFVAIHGSALQVNYQALFPRESLSFGTDRENPCKSVPSSLPEFLSLFS